jgi:hypothetical protein
VRVAGHTINAIFGNKDPKKVQIRGKYSQLQPNLKYSRMYVCRVLIPDVQNLIKIFLA